MKSIYLLILLLIAFSCTHNKPYDTPNPSSIVLPSSKLLPIPNRLQEPGKPPEGWCAEASIQMGLLFYNKEISQKDINLAGKPAHPDLYSDDIDKALNALLVNYTKWNERNRSLSKYISWIKLNISKGYPVFCGVKINPTKHPEWALDHFVLVVGYNENGLYVNTNHDDGQILITYEQLASYSNHYSIENSYHYYFGRALTGLKH